MNLAQVCLARCARPRKKHCGEAIVHQGSSYFLAKEKLNTLMQFTVRERDFRHCLNPVRHHAYHVYSTSCEQSTANCSPRCWALPSPAILNSYRLRCPLLPLQAEAKDAPSRKRPLRIMPYRDTLAARAAIAHRRYGDFPADLPTAARWPRCPRHGVFGCRCVRSHVNSFIEAPPFVPPHVTTAWRIPQKRPVRNAQQLPVSTTKAMLTLPLYFFLPCGILLMTRTSNDARS